MLLSALAIYLTAPLVAATASSSPSLDPTTPLATQTWIDSYSPTPTSWSLAPTFSDMSPFRVSSYVAATNIAILRGSPPESPQWNSDQHPFQSGWNDSVNCLQILYPKGSNAPHNKPQGGAEFYAKPLDISPANNVSLQYSVYFPPDFDFVKGGKLPGLYGGHKGCSGGDSAVDCFSTRMMWRTNGDGELYLYVPKDKQTPGLCSTPPKSICNSDYGLSIGRGAWRFARGAWTTIRQDIWLNTPGVNDGGFNIWIDNQLVMPYNQVRYRENAETCASANVQAQPSMATDSSESASPALESASPDPPTPSAPGPAVEPAALARRLDSSWSNSSGSAPSLDTSPPSDLAQPFRMGYNRPHHASDCSIGFLGLFFSTFFGGHTDDWSPKQDQYTYFKDFQMRINT